jgi:hypothetical protein
MTEVQWKEDHQPFHQTIYDNFCFADQKLEIKEKMMQTSEIIMYMPGRQGVTAVSASTAFIPPEYTHV